MTKKYIYKIHLVSGEDYYTWDFSAFLETLNSVNDELLAGYTVSKECYES